MVFDSIIHLVFDLIIYSFIHLVFDSFIHRLTHLIIYSFIHYSIHTRRLLSFPTHRLQTPRRRLRTDLHRPIPRRSFRSLLLSPLPTQRHDLLQLLGVQHALHQLLFLQRQPAFLHPFQHLFGQRSIHHQRLSVGQNRLGRARHVSKNNEERVCLGGTARVAEVNAAASRLDDFDVRTGSANEVESEGFKERSALGGRSRVDGEILLCGGERQGIGENQRTGSSLRGLKRIDEIGSDDERAVD